MTGSSSNGLVKFKIRTRPLPEEIIEFLQANVSLLKKVKREVEARTPQQSGSTHPESGSFRPKTDRHETEGEAGQDDEDDVSGGAEGDVERRPTVRPNEFWDVLAKLFAKAGPEWKGTCERIWSFGPLRVGPNILVDRRRDAVINSCVCCTLCLHHTVMLLTSLRDRTARNSDSRALRDFENSIETGFQIATLQGPLCAEPVVGMAFDVEDMELMEVDGHGGKH